MAARFHSLEAAKADDQRSTQSNELTAGKSCGKVSEALSDRVLASARAHGEAIRGRLCPIYLRCSEEDHAPGREQRNQRWWRREQAKRVKGMRALQIVTCAIERTTQPPAL